MGQKVKVFDESGNTVEEIIEETAAPESAAETDEVEAEASAEPDEIVAEPEQEAEITAAAPTKYKIGKRNFATQAEALAYAESQVRELETEAQLAEAYRQGIADGTVRTPAPENVTPAPAKPTIDPEKLYTNPQEFLAEYKEQIIQETRTALDQRAAVDAQSNQLWNEFTVQHPELSEFRGEVEAFVDTHQTEVRAVVGTKGRPAAYDYIAMKLKSRFEGYASALKPKRVLPNGAGGASPTQKGVGVTPKAAPKKVSTFYDQLRSIRKSAQ